MHRVIRFLVEAEDEQAAFDGAREGLNALTEEGMVDYGTFFYETNTKVSGVARYGEIIPIANLDSREGRFLLLEGINFDYMDFKDAIKEVRKKISATDFDLFQQHPWSRHCFTKVRYCQDFIVLDKGFVGIDQLKDAIDPTKLKRYWIIPCDVHT